MMWHHLLVVLFVTASLADVIGYQESVSCMTDANCQPSHCDVSRGWIRSYCGLDGNCLTEADNCNDHVSCTVDSCADDKGCQHDTAKCGCTDDGQCYDWNPCTTDICFNRICRHDAMPGCCQDHDDCDVGFRCQNGMCVRTKELINATCERIGERLMRCCSVVAKQPNADGSITVVNLCKDHPYDPEDEEADARAGGNEVTCMSLNGTMISGNALVGKEIFWYNNNFNINNNNNCKITIILEN